MGRGSWYSERGRVGRAPGHLVAGGVQVSADIECSGRGALRGPSADWEGAGSLQDVERGHRSVRDHLGAERVDRGRLAGQELALLIPQSSGQVGPGLLVGEVLLTSLASRGVVQPERELGDLEGDVVSEELLVVGVPEAHVGLHVGCVCVGGWHFVEMMWCGLKMKRE